MRAWHPTIGSTFMTSGEKAERIAGALLSILCAWVLAVSPQVFAQTAPSSDLGLSELMQMLSAVPAADGTFTERKYLSLFDEPLVLRGRVRYRAPDYVGKVYDDPNSEGYEVSGDDLTIAFPDGRRRHLSIDKHPVLRAFVESYRGTLAGDREALSRYFDLALSGAMDGWELRLTPRLAALTQILSAVIMRGREGRVLSVETLEANGDRSVMTLDVPAE